MFVSLTIRERQTKATLRYCLVPERMAVIKHLKNHEYWKGVGEKENL